MFRSIASITRTRSGISIRGSCSARLHRIRRRIALISGAIVLTLRHPLHVAKARLSVNTLSRRTLHSGVGSGDRPPEYAAFGRDPDERRELYRQHWETLAAAVTVPSRVIPDHAPEGAPDFYLLASPNTSIPLLAVGSGGQSVDWIARHSLGWMTYHREPQAQRGRYSMWRAAVDRAAPARFRAFGVAMRLDLGDDAGERATEISLGYRTGRHALVALLVSDARERHASRDAQHHIGTTTCTRYHRGSRHACVLPEFHR